MLCCRDRPDGNTEDEDLANRFKFNISDDGEGTGGMYALFDIILWFLSLESQKLTDMPSSVSWYCRELRQIPRSLISAHKAEIEPRHSAGRCRYYRCIKPDSPTDHFHVTSLPPCWRTITKHSSLASIVSSTNMAATSLSFEYLGIDCKPSIPTEGSLVWVANKSSSCSHPSS